MQFELGIKEIQAEQSRLAREAMNQAMVEASIKKLEKQEASVLQVPNEQTPQIETPSESSVLCSLILFKLFCSK